MNLRSGLRRIAGDVHILRPMLGSNTTTLLDERQYNGGERIFPSANRRGDNNSDSDTASEHVNNDWKELAHVLDRLFFWIVFIFMTASTMIILSVPLYKDVEKMYSHWYKAFVLSILSTCTVYSVQDSLIPCGYMHKQTCSLSWHKTRLDWTLYAQPEPDSAGSTWFPNHCNKMDPHLKHSMALSARPTWEIPEDPKQKWTAFICSLSCLIQQEFVLRKCKRTGPVEQMGLAHLVAFHGWLCRILFSWEISVKIKQK